MVKKKEILPTPDSNNKMNHLYPVKINWNSLTNMQRDWFWEFKIN
jgi:hypothetical protein